MDDPSDDLITLRRLSLDDVDERLAGEDDERSDGSSSLDPQHASTWAGFLNT